MALTEESGGNGFYMPVAPAYNYGGGNGGFGNGFGGDWAWIILLLLLGWGNNGWGGNANGGYANGGALYPWMNQADITTSGFQNQLLNDNITSIRDGVYGLSTQLCNCCGDISTQLCNGFAGTAAAVTGAQNALAQQMYTNQISDLERSFAAQTANTAGLTALQSQLASCCCDNRLATNDLKYTIATENCADRAASAANTQAILDKLCQLELDGYKRENDSLRTQLTSAQFAASQAAQTAAFQQGMNNEVDALYNRLSNCPVPTVPVYGRQPIFTCGGNCGCGNAIA